MNRPHIEALRYKVALDIRASGSILPCDIDRLLPDAAEFAMRYFLKIRQQSCGGGGSGNCRRRGYFAAAVSVDTAKAAPVTCGRFYCQWQYGQNGDT